MGREFSLLPPRAIVFLCLISCGSSFLGGHKWAHPVRLTSDPQTKSHVCYSAPPDALPRRRSSSSSSSSSGSKRNPHFTKKSGMHIKPADSSRAYGRSTSTGPSVSPLLEASMRRMMQTPLLTHDEEIMYGRRTRDLVEILQVRDTLEGKLGRVPTTEEWGMAVNASASLSEFQHRLDEGKHAKSMLVNSNLRLVVSVAKKFSNLGVSTQDLIQEGSFGLVRATHKFDPDRGFRFATYATWWIQQAIFRALAFNSRMIRLPMHMHNLAQKAKAARRDFLIHTGSFPSDEELAEHLGVTVSKIKLIDRSAQPTKSLSTPLRMKTRGSGFAASGKTLEDMKPAKDCTPEQDVERELFKEEIASMLEQLEQDERLVVKLRYGIGVPRRVSVSEISRITRQTEKWVKSKEAKALRKLRRPYEKFRLSPFSSNPNTLNVAISTRLMKSSESAPSQSPVRPPTLNSPESMSIEPHLRSFSQSSITADNSTLVLNA